MASAEVDDLVMSAGFDEKFVHSSDFLGYSNEVRPIIQEDLLRFTSTGKKYPQCCQKGFGGEICRGLKVHCSDSERNKNANVCLHYYGLPYMSILDEYQASKVNSYCLEGRSCLASNVEE